MKSNLVEWSKSALRYGRQTRSTPFFFIPGKPAKKKKGSLFSTSMEVFLCCFLFVYILFTLFFFFFKLKVKLKNCQSISQNYIFQKFVLLLKKRFFKTLILTITLIECKWEKIRHNYLWSKHILKNSKVV